MTNSELAKKIDAFLTQNLVILTKPGEEELATVLIEYVASNKKYSLQEERVLSERPNTPMTEYLLRSQQLSPKSEMEALTSILYRMGRCNYYPFNQSKLLKAIKQRITVLSEAIPQEIHFMSLVKFEAIQLDYIKLWIQQNASDYKINIWMDSGTLLAGELCGRLQEAAIRHSLNAGYRSNEAFKTQLIDWQDKAYKNIVKTMSQYDASQPDNRKFSFDQAVIIFLEANGLAKPGELIRIRKANADSFQFDLEKLRQGTDHPDNVRLIDFHPMNKLPDYQLYIKELASRGNLIAATDISRLLILEEYGGLYLNNELLPSLHHMLITQIGKIDAIDVSKTQSQEVIMRVVLDELTRCGEMPARASILASENRGGYIDQLQGIDDIDVQRIRDKVIEAIDRRQPLFAPLGKLTVDPYFQYNYADRNNKAIIATPSSRFIDQVLTNVRQIHEVIGRHNIDGLNPTQSIPRAISNEIMEDLQANGLLFCDNSSLLSYRSEGIVTANIPGTREIGGIIAYDHAYAALLEDIGVVPDRYPRSSLHKILSPVTPAFFATEEAYLSRLRGPGIKLPYDVFPQHSNYDSQYIIQLQDDASVNPMARYLYNKNSNSTTHYLYQQASNELVAVNIAPNFEFNRRTRIILISHGRFMQALGGKKIVRLLISKGLLKKDADGLFPVVDRISIAACYITERVPEGSAAAALPPKPVTDIPPEKFIEDLYHSFSAVKIPVNSISVREKLVAVDVLGRKWSGEPINPNAPENKWQINWALQRK